MKKIVKIFTGVLVVIVVSLIVLFLFRNMIFENAIEKFGTIAAGAKVEVDGAEIFLLDAKAGWERIQVADADDTWKNIFETGKCEFGLKLRPLLAGKFIVDSMVVSDVRSATKRTSDGKIEKKEKTQDTKPSWIKTHALKQLENEKKKIPVLDPELFEKKIDTDAIIAALELITPGEVEKLHAFADKRYLYWEAKLKDKNYEKRARSIRDDAKKVDIDRIKNIDEFRQNITKADDIIKRAKVLRKEIIKERKKLKTDFREIKNSANQIPGWIKTDYDTALKKAKLADFSAENISKLLFGDRVTSVVMTALNYIEKTRNTATSPTSVKKNHKEKMPELPGLWIKKIHLSATVKDSLLLKGDLTDISSDQKRTGKPFGIKLSGDSEKTGKIYLEGIMDYRGETYNDTFKLTVNQLPVKGIKLADSSIFPKKIKSGNGKLIAAINVKNRSMASEIDFNLTDVIFDYSSIKNPEKKASQIAKRVASKINEIVLKCSANAENDNMNFNLSSNIDNVLSAEVKSLIKDEIENAKLNIKKKLNKKLGNYKKEFSKKAGVKEKELEELLSVVSEDSEAQKKIIETKKRQLEKKLKKKIQKKSEKAGKDLIKKLKLKF